MKTVTVSASKTYDILIAPGLIDDAGILISSTLACHTASQSVTAAIVTDDTVNSLYGDRLSEALTEAGYRVVRFVFKNGEASKSAENYIELLEFLATNSLTRSDVLIALGGGVVGDLGGFAASTYQRGIALVQMPTTLLSAVDSSVGGKTAIDLKAGKNLAGTFYQPELVICDTALLGTLPEAVFQDGLAEVIKYGVIADPHLFNSLKEPIKPQLEAIIARCVEIKRDIVSIDEYETGPRKLLNFGHTIGHAIEACSKYTISHGSAVAAGMGIIARASFKMGLCSQETSEAIIKSIAKHGLPIKTSFNAAQLTTAALRDKKRSGGTITLIIPEIIGRAVLHNVPVSELERIIGFGLTDV